MEVTGLFGATLSGSAAASQDITGLSNNFDDFLTLLTTQLQYQDPLEPMDSNEFIGQLTQFTQVEQTIKSNGNLETLLELQAANQGVAAIGFIGKTVEVVGTDLPLVNGEGTFTYTLDTPSAATTVAVMDSSGKVVFSTAGETETGKHAFTWDGRDNNGVQLPDGAYRIAVAARDGDNQQMDTTTTVFGAVDGVESSEGGVLLSMGAVNFLTNAIISVRQATSEESNG